MKIDKIAQITFIISLLYIYASANAQTAIIIHHGVEADSLAQGTIDQIFTQFQKKWNSDLSIVIYFPKEDKKLQNTLFGYLGRSGIELKRTWLRKKLTGEATPPIAVKTSDEMLDKVSTTPGAIGFIDLKKVTKDVKIAAIIP